MLDADIAATDAARLAKFAERVAEFDRPAAGPPADRVRRLIARVALLRRWPAVRSVIADPPPTADATLSERSRQLAERCRGGAKRGLFRSADTADLLTEAADRLAQLADRLDAAHAPSGVIAQIERVLDGWKRTDPLTLHLGQLAAALADLSDVGREVLDDLHDHPPGHVFTAFDTRLKPADGWTPDTRAAAGLTCVLIDRLTQLTSDPAAWGVVREWVDGWFRHAGLKGKVVLDGSPPAAAVVESFPLKDPGRRVMLAVVPPGGGTADTSDAGGWPGWVELPPVPVFAGEHSPPLEAWAAAVRSGPADESAARVAFTEWLDSAAGADWFHHLLAAVAAGDGAAAVWWQAVRDRGWCEAFPTVGANGVTWPTGVPLEWPTASSTSSDRPFGEIVQVLKFALRPGDARVTLSDGPGTPGSPIAAFGELTRFAAEDPRWWGEGKWAEARQLCQAVDPPRVAALAGHWLDNCSPTDAQVEAVCRWVEACGLTAVRVGGIDTPGVVVRSVFAAAPSGTLVATNRAGFRRGSVAFREATAEVSLGPQPPGFADLQHTAEQLPPSSELRGMVAGLRTAAEGNYLREAVLQLYTDFWGDAGMAARVLAPDVTAEVGDRLSALLADAYGLSPFHPVNVHDLPSGWITVAAGSRVMTGVVARVLRPGLQDAAGNLRIPAVVEVE